MVPIETVSVDEDGYTFSPTASQCSSMELRNGAASQWSPIELPNANGSKPQRSLIFSPSGTAEPLFPRFQQLQDVSVTPVAPAVRTSGQVERKQQRKGRGFGNRKTREGKWRSRSQQDLSLESQGQTTALSHRKVKIPPLPKRFSLMALNQKYYKNPPLKQPELSEQEKNANMIESMRNEVLKEGPPLIPPRRLPSEVHFLGFTEEGTVMITFTDEKNLNIFRRNEERIEMWFGQKKVLKLDTRIKKDDIFKGRVVLASIPRLDGGHRNVRAMISDFNDKWIIVDGLDHSIYQRKLSYDNVSYQLKDFNFSPFQIQEVHLEGLENHEGSPVLRFIIKGLKQTIAKWAEDERLSVPDKLVLMKIQKGKDGGYKVRLAFPENFLEGLSLNKILMESIRNFDPFVNYLVTP